MSFEEEQKQISKYNDAGYSISRLHESWLRCAKFIRRGDFKRWKYELDMIWLELYPDVIRQKNSKDLIKDNKRLMVLVANSKTRSQEFFNLMERHEFLRTVQDVAGKAGVYKDENEDAFE